MKSQKRVDLVQLSYRQTQGNTVSGILIIRVRDNRIQAIVPAGKLNHHQDGVAFPALALRSPR